MWSIKIIDNSLDFNPSDFLISNFSFLWVFFQLFFFSFAVCHFFYMQVIQFFLLLLIELNDFLLLLYHQKFLNLLFYFFLFWLIFSSWKISLMFQYPRHKFDLFLDNYILWIKQVVLWSLFCFLYREYNKPIFL